MDKRFDESTINYLYMLGRSAEGIEEWGKTKHYYADAHFAPTPHVEARAGLERVYHQIERRSTDTFEAFSRTPKLSTVFEKMLIAKKFVRSLS